MKTAFDRFVLGRLLPVLAFAGLSAIALSAAAAQGGQAAPPGGSPEVCKGCHAAYVESYEATTHAKKGHPRTPANAGACETCHGDTTAHVKAGGGKVLGASRHPIDTSDFSSYVLQAQASKAKVIGFATAGQAAINAIKTAGEFGLGKGKVLAGLYVFISDVHSLGLNVAQGMYVTTGFYWDRDEAARKWSRRFFDKTKRMPTMIQAANYSATLHYLKAIQAAGTDDSAAVMAKMREAPINDFFATNGRIRSDGRMVHDMYLAQVKKPSESKYPWDYYSIKAVIPADKAFQPLAKGSCALAGK